MGFSESIARRDPGMFDATIWRAANGDASLAALIKGLIARESAWNVGAFRWEPAMGEGSVGLMQVLPSTAKQALGVASMTISDLFIPETNIAAGAAYLKYQLNRYGDARRAVSAYNCGSECLMRPTSFWPNGNAAYADDVLTYQVWYMNHLTAPPSDTTPVFYSESDYESPEATPESSWEIPTETLGIGLGILVLGAAAMLMMRKR